MKNALSLLFSIVLLLLTTQTILAEDDSNAGSEKDAIKISNGTVEISANFTGTVFGFATIPSVSYSITDAIQISGGFYYETGTTDNFDYEALGVSFFGIYNFYLKSIDRLVPFVQTGYNYASFEFESFDINPLSLEDVDVVDSSGFFVGGGARFFFNDNMSVNAIINRQFGDSRNWRFGIGISAFVF